MNADTTSSPKSSSTGLCQGLACLSALVAAGLLGGCKDSAGSSNAKTAETDAGQPGAAAPDSGHAAARGDATDAAPSRSDPDAENLKAVMLSLRAAQAAGDGRKLETIVRDLCPDETRIRAALRPGVDEGVIRKIVELRPGWQNLLNYEARYTDVKVSGATGQQIADGGGGEGGEFGRRGPGVATTLLRPEMSYYVAEFTPPGESRGQKFYFFFRDGDRWFMLGQLWQVLNAGVGRG